MPPVLYIHHRPQASGAARSLALLIEALDARWKPHVLVPEGAAAAEFRSVGAQVHPAPVPAFVHTWDAQYRGGRWLVFGRETLRLPGHLRRLRAVLRCVEPALVHVNDSVMLASGWYAHRRGVPVVWHLRSSLASGGRDRRSRWIAGRLDSWGDAAIAIDSDVAATFPLGLPIEVVPNPVVNEEDIPVELRLPAGRVAVGYFGYLRRQKGWPQFVEAIRIAADDGIPVHAIVVGGGVRPPAAFAGARGSLLRRLGVRDEESDMRRRVTELGLDDRFTFLPFTTRPGSIYDALDIVVFPNQGAGLGRPVLEAAAHGKPVIASGSPDGAGILLPDRTGTLLPDGSAKTLARSLAHLVSDLPLREKLGRQAAAHARARFDPGACALSVEEVYDALVQAGE